MSDTFPTKGVVRGLGAGVVSAFATLIILPVVVPTKIVEEAVVYGETDIFEILSPDGVPALMVVFT